MNTLRSSFIITHPSPLSTLNITDSIMADTQNASGSPTPTPSTLMKFIRSLAVLIGGAVTMWLAKLLNIEIPVELGNGIVDLITMGLAAGVAWVIARIFPKQ